MLFCFWITCSRTGRSRENAATSDPNWFFLPKKIGILGVHVKCFEDTAHACRFEFDQFCDLCFPSCELFLRRHTLKRLISVFFPHLVSIWSCSKPSKAVEIPTSVTEQKHQQFWCVRSLEMRAASNRAEQGASLNKTPLCDLSRKYAWRTLMSSLLHVVRKESGGDMEVGRF